MNAEAEENIFERARSHLADGLKNGFVLLRDLEADLPLGDLDAKRLSYLYEAFSSLKIKIIDEEDAVEDLADRGERSMEAVIEDVAPVASSGDILESFLSDLSQWEVLTQEEEVLLAKRIAN